MKSLLCLLALPLLATLPVHGATTYTDTIGDNFDGNSNMDIASVVVDSSATSITFTINLAGPITSPNDWGKYLVGITANSSTGDTGDPVGNPWGRNLRMADGMDAFVGSWADGGGGAQSFTWGGGSWTQNGDASSLTLGASSSSFTFNLTDLGLSAGQSIGFDVYTTGENGGDGPNDAVANPNQTTSNWGDPYTTPGSGTGGQLSYTIVPEVSVSLLGALAGLFLLRRRR